MIAVVLLNMNYGNSLCDTPACKSYQIETEQCHSYWWTNILYINNYYPSFKKSVSLTEINYIYFLDINKNKKNSDFICIKKDTS